MAGMRARKQLTQDMLGGGGGAGLEHVLSCKHMKISRGGKLEVCVRLRGHSCLLKQMSCNLRLHTLIPSTLISLLFGDKI